MNPSRDIPLQPHQSALLFIDVQNFSAHRQGAEFKDMDAEEFNKKYGWFFARLEMRVIPNMQRLQAACRAFGIEVLYTTIESLTLDGRDRSLDYKITGFHVPKGSWDGKVIEQIAPIGDEIVLPKTSSSVFVSNPHRLSPAKSGCKAAGDFRTGYRSMRGKRNPRCVRSGLSCYTGHRCLPYLQPDAARIIH